MKKKGLRTLMFTWRLSVEERRRLGEVAEAHGITPAMVLRMLLKREHDRCRPTVTVTR